MASAWGLSWARAWGNSWGALSGPPESEETQPFLGAGGVIRAFPKEKRDLMRGRAFLEAEEELIILIASGMV